MDFFLDFVGYTFSFWATWKCLDGFYYWVRPSKVNCSLCKENLQERKNLAKTLEQTQDNLSYDLAQVKKKNSSLLDQIADQKVYIRQLHEEVKKYRFEEMHDESLEFINCASADQLDLIRTVGPITAKKIISHRPYTHLTELKDIVGDTTFFHIQKHLKIID